MVKDLKILTSIMDFRFNVGDYVKKKGGSFWKGEIVGYYSTTQTPEGYCVQLPTQNQNGPVQIYPVDALEYWEPSDPEDLYGL